MSRIYHPNLINQIVASGTEKDPLVLEGIVRKQGDGSLFLSWTGGGNGEPTLENVVKYRRSFDEGKSWTEESILFAHPRKGMFNPALFVDGNSLYAFPGSYYSYYETGFSQDMQTYISVSHDCGETFSIPHSIPGCINNIHIKCTRKVGNRWIFPCSWVEITDKYWASASYANKPCVVAGKEMVQPAPTQYKNGIEYYLDWHWNHTEFCGVLISDDEGSTFRICGRIGHEGTYFVEPMMAVLSDGTLVMLLRTKEHRLYESRSYDNGETWSDPVPTDIPSPITKVCLLQDSVGRIYLLHNPNPGGRNPLSLWISKDDMHTWGTKIDLVQDLESPLCYPDGFIDEERGKLCFAWDDRKHIYYSEYPLG